MTNIPDGFEVFPWRPEDQERCSFCPTEDAHIWVEDPDEPGLYDLLLCDGCYGRSQRLIIGTDLV